jgi:aconitate decarboxylase
MSTMPTDPLGPTGLLASWVADLTLDSVPAAVRDRARHLLLDGVGCAVIGAQLPWSRVAAEAVLDFEGEGRSPVIGWGRTTNPSAAALLNSTFIQGFELDDFHPLAPLHSTSLVIPAILAAATGQAVVSGKSFLTAAVAGFEVGPRVGLALHGSEMLSRGWHSGPVFGTHAAAAAAGRFLGLTGAQMEDAFGLAATQSGGLMAAQFGAMSKRMQHGFAARNGLLSATLARGGYTGIRQVYEQPYGGFLSTFGEGHDPDASQIASELGERWETERIVVKHYAAMGGLHAALDALFEIDVQRPLVADEIASIDVDLSHAVYHHGWWPPERPLTPTGAQMNIAYVLAAGVLDHAALVDQFSPSRIDSDDVWTLIPRIAAHHNPEFDALGAIGRGQTKLTVRFTDGSSLESSQFAPKSALEPLSNEMIVQKFRHLTNGVLDHSRQQTLEQLVLDIDQLDDLAPFVDALAAPVASPFEL